MERAFGPPSALIFRRFRVPAESKESIKADLRAAGISRRFLFPDLDNLAGDIIEPAHLQTMGIAPNWTDADEAQFAEGMAMIRQMQADLEPGGKE